ncbi:glycosyltransferase family 25 protein [Falsihalocynthiibacter sp. S25ZX9]|uniref:glycosyltransferase family 25 protein n=1 Tax=Falsihalocynthiibacter sp. S25ZX9 TaxID=3240870 RepID=UPI00350EEF1C
MLILKICEELTEDEISLGVRRVPPVWGAKMGAADYFSQIAPSLTRGEDPLTPAELGCTLAHLECYSIILEEGRSALILEDDMFLNVQTLQAVKLLDEKGLEFVHLAQSALYTFRGHAIDDNLYEIDPRKDFWGGAAYLLTPAFAQELKEFHTASIQLADAWADFFRNRAGDSPHYSPIFFHTGETSSIRSSRKMARKLSVKGLMKRRALQWLERRTKHLQDRVRGLASPIGRIPNTTDPR